MAGCALLAHTHMPRPPKMKQLFVRLEPLLHAGVKQAAREKGLDQTEYVRRALRALVMTHYQHPETEDRLLAQHERRWEK